MEATSAKKRKLPAKQIKKAKPSPTLNMWFDIPKDGVLLPSIEKHLLKKQAKQDRRLDCIHPSAMAHHDWCPRMEYFKLKGGVPPIDPVRFQMSNVFEEGHLIHRKWQKWLKEIYPMFTAEVPLRDDTHMIQGHCDGIVRVDDTDYVIEIKSIGLGTMRYEEPELVKEYKDVDELWKNLKRPIASHVKQANIYMALLMTMGHNVQDAVFLYEYKPTQAVKEFSIKYSNDIAEPLFIKALDIANRIRDNGSAPDCYTGTSCKNCEAYETAYRRIT